MCLKSELRKLLKEDQSFRMEILEILRDDLNEMINVEVYAETPSGSAETEVSVSVCLQELSPMQIENSLRSDFNKYAQDGFSHFWKRVPKEQRKRKESCKKMFYKMCESYVMGMESTEFYFELLNKKIQEFIAGYEKFDKKEQYLPYGYLENIINTLTVHTSEK